MEGRGEEREEGTKGEGKGGDKWGKGREMRSPN